MAVLKFLKGSNADSSVTLSGEKIVLGRNQDCTVVLNVPAVSREHAIIRLVNGQYFIEDLKSRNGTFVNNKEVVAPTALKNNDRIKICDNLMAFVDDERPPLPANMRAVEPNGESEWQSEEEDSSATVEATITSQSSKQILEAQPTDKLAALIGINSQLTQVLNVEELLPKIVDSLFEVFRQADRGFFILADERNLIPKVVKTRRGDETEARFSRRIINNCLETSVALLSEDASSDKRFDLSQSIADCRIRSVMCAPLIGRSSGDKFGVLQLDTQDRNKKFVEEDLKLLVAVATQAAIALENAKMHEDLVARAGLERDLKTAHQVQVSFLPKQPPQVDDYEFFAHYESAQEVGGDYYDFIPLPDSRLGIMLGDVAGKGIPAALLMAKVSSDARFCTLTEPSLADAVYKLNELMQEAGMLDRFVTLGACLLQPSEHKLTIVNAGHNPPVLFRKQTGALAEATTREHAGFPLGVADGIPYDSADLQLDPGDVLVLFSDGVTEATGLDESEFGMDRLYKALDQEPRTPAAMGQRLVDAVKEFSAGRKQHDDITVVCFGRLS